MILRTGPSPSRGKPRPSSVPIRNPPPGSAIIPSRVASLVPTSFGGRPEDCSETCLVGTQQEGVILSRGVRPMLSPSPVLIGRKIPPMFSYIYRLPTHGGWGRMVGAVADPTTPQNGLVPEPAIVRYVT